MHQSIRTRVGEVYLNTDRIVIVHYDDIAEVQVSDIEEIKQAKATLTSGKPHCCLIESGKYTLIAKNAREFAQGRAIGEDLAQAIVVSSLAQRIVGNYYARKKDFPAPVRLFGSRESAMAWLHDLQRRQQEAYNQAIPA